MAVANQTPANVASDYATILFVIRQIMGGMATASLVRVKSCTNDGGLAPVGMIEAQLLVDMQTEDGQTIPHGTLFQVPYGRMQGGANAVILDPQAGDLGLCVFSSRDISAVKKDPTAARDRMPSPGAPPGSKRVFSLADGLYVGGLLNGVPTQYVQFNADGISVVSPSTVTIQAPTINLVGDVFATGTITSDVDVIAGTISGKTHTHPDGSPNTGPPNP